MLYFKVKGRTFVVEGRRVRSEVDFPLIERKRIEREMERVKHSGLCASE